MKTKDQLLLENAYNTVIEMAYGVSKDQALQKSVTIDELVELIRQLENSRKGTNFISVTQITKEQSNKAPFPRFLLPGLKDGRTYFAKVSLVNGEIGTGYKQKRENLMAKQGTPGTFVPQKSIYDSVDGSDVLRIKDDQLYIQYYPRQIAKAFKPVIVKANKENPSQPGDFDIISRDEISQYKGPQREYPPVEVRIMSLDSIAAIKINKAEYINSELDPVRKAIWQASGAPMPEDNPPVPETTETENQSNM